MSGLGRQRSGRLRGTASFFLDEERVTVEIGHEKQVIALHQTVDELGHVAAPRKAIVVEHRHAADRKPGPDPVENVVGRLIDIDVDVTKSDRPGRDVRGRLLRKNTAQDRFAIVELFQGPQVLIQVPQLPPVPHIGSPQVKVVTQFG
jgi:hypothetical protein